MPVNFPTYNQVLDRIRSDIRGLLPDVDPTIYGSIIRAFGDSLGSRMFDAYLLQRQLLLEFFPQTASGEYLERWGNYDGLSRNPATGSDGGVLFVGTIGATIPAGTILRSSSREYTVDSTVSISTQSISIATLTQSGGNATATTSTAHGLATGVTVTISGATETEYNGSYVVTVLSATSFSYMISGNPSSPATGTISAAYTGVQVSVTSSGTGAVYNLSSGAILTLGTPISGVSATAYVQFAGVTGGTDVETDEEYRVRILDRRANPVANFNSSQIETRARSVSGVTRVWVLEITPFVGAVTVYFVRDNDPDIIPDANEIADVKDAILEILPANSAPGSLYVLAPTPVVTNYVFSAISPDTTTMRQAIENSLSAFYEDKAELSTTVTQDQYRSAIQETQDPETGEFLQSFTLTSPSGNITVAAGEIPQLGTVTF